MHTLSWHECTTTVGGKQVQIQYMLFAHDEIYNGFALKYCGHSVSKVSHWQWNDSSSKTMTSEVTKLFSPKT